MGKWKEDLGEDAYIVAVWLTDKPDTTKEFLAEGAANRCSMKNAALSCFTGEKTGPKDWNVNADAQPHRGSWRTRGKWSRNFGYNAINETDVPKGARGLEASEVTTRLLERLTERK